MLFHIIGMLYTIVYVSIYFLPFSMELSKSQKAWLGFGVVIAIIAYLFWLIPSPQYGNTPQQAAVGCALARAQAMDGSVNTNAKAVPLPNGDFSVDVTTPNGVRVCRVIVRDADKAFCETECK